MNTEGEGGFLARWSRRKAQALDPGSVASDASPRPRPVKSGPLAHAAKASPSGDAKVGPCADAASALAAAAPPSTVTSPASPFPTEPSTTPAAGQGGSVRPAPTLDDVARLDRDGDYAPFVARGVDEGVKRAALKKLFTDPHFNVMDGLDIYIDDYSVPDPIPLTMLRQMNQSHTLRLFEEETQPDAAAAPVSPPEPMPALPDAGVDLIGVEVAPAWTSTPPATPPHDHPDLQLQPDDAAGRPGPAPSAGA
jgi:hypothetical protein